MVDFASLAKTPVANNASAPVPQMPLKWGGGGEGGPYVEKPEERERWHALVGALRGVVGAEVDLRAKWSKLKSGVTVMRWDKNLRQRVQKYPNAKGTKGCGLVFEITEPGLEGLHFYIDGAESLFPTTPLAKVTNACAGRKFRDDEMVNPYEYVGREFVLTVALGNPVQPRDDGQHLNKGGHYWDIRGFKQIPVVLSFAQQAAQAPEAAPPPVAAPAPAATPAQGDDLDDLFDVPF